MKKERRNSSKKKFKLPALLAIFIRYFILIIVSIPNLWFFYFIFTPLTVYAVYFLLGLFYNVSLVNNLITVSGNFPIELIGACIAGSAYYLLLILNLSTGRIELVKRIKLILFSFSFLFVINVLRILILSIIFVNGESWFNTAHILFWYLGSVVFVVGIWFISVRVFRVKRIPFYSDLKFINSGKDVNKP